MSVQALGNLNGGDTQPGLCPQILVGCFRINRNLFVFDKGTFQATDTLTIEKGIQGTDRHLSLFVYFQPVQTFHIQLAYFFFQRHTSQQITDALFYG
jgi:hypothetical protein